jgi:hypothetical protein
MRLGIAFTRSVRASTVARPSAIRARVSAWSAAPGQGRPRTATASTEGTEREGPRKRTPSTAGRTGTGGRRCQRALTNGRGRPSVRRGDRVPPDFHRSRIAATPGALDPAVGWRPTRPRCTVVRTRRRAWGTERLAASRPERSGSKLGFAPVAGCPDVDRSFEHTRKRVEVAR